MQSLVLAILNIQIVDNILCNIAGTDTASDHRMTAQRLKMKESRLAELEGKLKQSVQVRIVTRLIKRLNIAWETRFVDLTGQFIAGDEGNYITY